MYLSIVIPAYNEEKRIGVSLDKLVTYLKKQGYDYEIIIVDDGSSDNTKNVVRAKLKGTPYRLFVNERNRGKGYSVRRGMLEAQGEKILFSDADFSAPVEELAKLLDAIEGGYDIAIGSRALKDSNVVVHQTWLREHMGKMFNLIARLFTFGQIHDSQCGFKCFRHGVVGELFSRQHLDGFCFDAEILFIAQQLRYKIKEIPINWVNSPQSKVGLFSDAVKMFFDLIRVRWWHSFLAKKQVKVRK